MITEIVRFPIPAGMDRETVLEAFESSAERWRREPELRRKHYLYDEAAGIAGGVYLWTSRAAAEAAHDAAWRAGIAERFGGAPSFDYFETPVIVDNEG